MSVSGTAAATHEAHLTRFGPELYELVKGKPTTYKDQFRAIDGPAKLVLEHVGVDDAEIEINGESVVNPEHFKGDGEVVVALQLKKENTIRVFVPGIPGGKLGVRVTQITEADLGITSQNYFGLNTTDIERQRAFYDTLGFVAEIYPAGPETSETFARGLGFYDNYLIYVALTSLEDPPRRPFVDTVQFRGNSFREEPPYEKLNHIGMAYATYSTPDLDGDYAYLVDKGVDFVSAPTVGPNGEKFVFMRDQDGTFLKLIQIDEVQADGVKKTSKPDLVRLENTNMNVADLERSREFYRLLGFTESSPGSQAGSDEFAAAHGFEGSIEFEGVDVSLGEGADKATLQLRQWKQPFDPSPAYAPPVNHLGIDRIAFNVKSLTKVVEIMTELGFERLGPIASPGPEYGLVFFFDPDGIKVQFSGPLTE